MGQNCTEIVADTIVGKALINYSLFIFLFPIIYLLPAAVPSFTPSAWRVRQKGTWEARKVWQEGNTPAPLWAEPCLSCTSPCCESSAGAKKATTSLRMSGVGPMAEQGRRWRQHSERQVPAEGPGSARCRRRDGARQPRGRGRTARRSGRERRPSPPGASPRLPALHVLPAVEAELPAHGRGDRAEPGGLPAAGQPRGRRGQRDFVGLYCKRRKAKANFAVGEESRTGSHVPPGSISACPERAR